MKKSGYTKYANAFIYILLLLVALAIFGFVWYISKRLESP